MTGVPTQFAIADLVLEELHSAGTAPADEDLPYFYLGAIGPALGDFLPTRVDGGPDPANAPMAGVWLPILSLLAGTPDSPGLVENMTTLRTTLSKLAEAVGDNDKFALLAIKSDLEALPDVVDALTAQVANVNSLRLALPLAILKVKARPKTPPAGAWHCRDTLHGHRTGAFWGELRRRAAESGDSRLQAFGLGVTVGYAGAVCGNPFVNGVVGAPHRNHWWRHRWVSQYVDAWVWGYYGARRRVRKDGKEIVFSNGGRVPVPPLATWDNIAGAELQSRFAVGGITAGSVLDAFRDGVAVPAHLPEELVTLLVQCYADTVDSPSPDVDAAGVQGAYAMTWLTTWITSSTEFLGATPPDQVNGPDECGERPDWVAVDGSVVVGGTVVPPPQISQPSPSAASIASAIAAAILAVAAFLTGGAAAGIVLIIAAVAIVDDATDPDWEALRCHTGWVNVFIGNLENAFRDLLSAAGLGPPYAVQLAHNEIQFQLSNTVVPPFAALATCRSPSANEDSYPASVWQPSPTQSNWTRYPTENPEEPGQVSYVKGSWWPRHFVDGFSFVDNGPAASPRYASTQDNPLADPGAGPTILDLDEWQQRMSVAEDGGTPQGAFGNAVDVALALLRDPQSDLLHWDLDGDRGLGWPTWVEGDGPGDVVRE